MSIPAGARLLVTGPTKDCAGRPVPGDRDYRARGGGGITRPPLDEILFLPQRPELPPVTLRDLLLEPGRAAPDDQILAALRGRSGAHRGAGRRARRGAGLGVLRVARRPAVAGPHPGGPRGPAVRFPGPRRDRTRTGPRSAGIQRLTENSITPIHFAEAAESGEEYDAVLEIDADGAWAWRWTDAKPTAGPRSQGLLTGPRPGGHSRVGRADRRGRGRRTGSRSCGYGAPSAHRQSAERGLQERAVDPPVRLLVEGNAQPGCIAADARMDLDRVLMVRGHLGTLTNKPLAAFCNFYRFIVKIGTLELNQNYPKILKSRPAIL